MKTPHQNLEIGCTQGDIKKNLQKNANQGVVKLRKPSILIVLSFILSFLFPERLHYTTCTITVITLTPCALNVEFQHFILRFNKKFHYFADTTARGDRGRKEAQRQGDFTDNSIFVESFQLLHNGFQRY
jgi:hypothetical protein